MQTIKNILGLLLITLLFVVACKESPKTSADETADSITTALKSRNPGAAVYDPTIDPSIVGAAFSKILHDTLGIKMFEVTLKPGDSLGLHSHPDHIFYLLDTGTAVLYVPNKSKGDTITGGIPGETWIMGPYNDAAKNIGKTAIRWIEIDIHRPRGIKIPTDPGYDADIDAFTLGGESIQKLGDTLGIKMFIATIQPGDTVTLHSHPDHTVYVLEGGELAVTFPGQSRQIMKLEKGTGFIGGPFSDAAKNTGTTTVKLFMTHIYRPRKK